MGLQRIGRTRAFRGEYLFVTISGSDDNSGLLISSGPALTIAGPYAKRIAWGPIWVGIRIITIVVIGAGPMEVRGPLRPHTLQWLKASPEYHCVK